MTHAVFVQTKVAAKDIDAYNRPAVCADALDNGNVIVLATEDTSATYGQTEVWDATKPATATLSGTWMVYEPEVVLTVSGTKTYKGIDPDPQDFYIPAGVVFSAFKPQLGDIILMTGDGFVSGSGAASAFAVAADNSYLLTWAAAAGAGLSFKYIATSYISIGSGAIDTQRVVAYKLQCVVL
jgi:hypothetical protein